jgi:shikimate dehydrogenase
MHNNMRNYKFPNPETKLCMTIGHPVAKQKTVFMHNAGYESLGINFLYLVQDILPESLQKGVDALKSLGVAGFSVTMPHKVEIVKFLDVQTDAVQKIGACNTVHFENGKLVGYNSDWIGAITCLKKKLSLAGKNVVVLGAGGAARAVIYGLLQEKANVTVLNRTESKAQELGTLFGVSWGSIDDTTRYENHDVLINATSVGTKRQEECDCYLCRFLGLNTSRSGEKTPFLENKVALDVVFQRNNTEFTRAAVAHGYNVAYGHEMLVAQGSFQFKLFTGFDAPEDVMYAELKKCLEDW